MRRQAGCAILFLFDVLALCVLLYFALGAGMLMPMDCFDNQPCEASRDAQFNRVVIIFWMTVAVNAALLVWAVVPAKR
jgi:hypothetical protein